MYIRAGGRASRLAQSCALLAVLGVAAPVWAQAPVAPRDPRAVVARHIPPPIRTADEHRRIASTLSRLPIRFEPLGSKGTFLARGIGPAVRLTGTSIDFPIGTGSHPADSIRVEFAGARKSSRVTGVDLQPGRINYLYGDDPAKWRTNVQTYARAKTESVYRGIDVEYYGAGEQLEYDFIVKAGAHPDAIRLSISGASVSISDNGDLMSSDRVLLRKPVAYQSIDGDRRNVSIDYRRRADGSFGFRVGAYDRSQSLVIDPIVQASFTFGGNGDDRIADMAVDEVGAVYVGGATYSSDFPTVNPAEARQDAGTLNCVVGDGFVTRCSDGLLAKLRPDGAALEYATYVGFSGFDSVEHVVVDASHALYFTGFWIDVSRSWAFPDSGYFIGKLTPDGSRFLYKIVSPGSVFGSRSISDLAAGADGSAYLLTRNGSSSEVGILSPTGGNYHPIVTIPQSTGVLTTIAARGNSIFVAGWTSSPEFPVTSGAAQAQFGGSLDGVVMRLNVDGTVVYSTFVGGTSVDQIWDLAVDSNGNAYAAGDGWSNNAVCQNNTADLGFITKLSADGSSKSYTTPFFFPFGQCSDGRQPRVAVDNSGNAYGGICGHGFINGTNLHRCDLWKVGPTGTILQSELDVPSDVFAVDATGGEWFGSTTDDSRQDARVVKLVPLKFNALTTDVSLPVRFASRMTWTADVEAISGVEYTFLRYSSADGWVVAQAYGPEPSYTWTPASWDVGDHYLCAIARLLASPDITAYSCVQFTISGLSPGQPAVLAPAADFYHDRRPDLVWIHQSTGQLALWNMGGGAYGERMLTGEYLNAPALPTGWRVAGAADIDGDGQTDLFLQSDTGLLGAWFFDGTTLRYGMTLTPGLVDPQWQIRAVGDLNHDGHPDLIWQYAPTGQVAFWLMNGTTAIGYVIPDVMAPGGDWEVVGTGDSNRDGERDIFWQQRSTSTLAVWWMSGTMIQGASLLSANPGDPKWRAVAVADLDGDAYSDLIFQHADTRMVAAWYLRGATVRFGATLMPSTVADPAWKIAGPR